MNKVYTLILSGIIFYSVSGLARAEDAEADVTLPVLQHNVVRDVTAMAKSDPQGFVEYALKNYQSHIHDYTCTFIKKELVRGKYTKEQYIKVKFREGPFAVFMKWVKNAGLVDRVLYIKGQNDNKALVKPAGILGWFVPTHVKRPVNGPDAAKVSRRRLDQFGFANTLKLILAVNARAEKAKDLKFEFSGELTRNGRKTLKFERFLPNKPYYPDQHLVLLIDKEMLVPVGTFAYNENGKLLGKYVYKNIKLNTGLAWKEFTPEANGM